MISKRMEKMCNGSSLIRAMFEEGNRMAKIYGRENVYDFSLGNPNFPAPEAINNAVKEIIDTEDSTYVHGYMSNSGYSDVRKTVADNLNRRFGCCFDENNIIMTVGAAGGINCMLQTLINEGDEVIVFAPYFLEYGNYVANWGGKLKVVPSDLPTFLPSAEALNEALTEKTKAIIINNPNNPTGIVYDEDTLRALARVLENKEREYSHPIYIISDEPYRELVYDDIKVPFIPNIYKNTLVGYSWSKSLSLPGERIGYIAISPSADDAGLLFDALTISTRIIGFVNAPSLMQRVVARCIDYRSDIEGYDINRRLLYSSLTQSGFECVKPQGAFYLWVKTPCPDSDFTEKAKQHRILLVPGAAFACPGYVRIAYCVSKEQIERAIPEFQALAKELGIG